MSKLFFFFHLFFYFTYPFFKNRLLAASHTWNVFGFSHRLKRWQIFLLCSLWCLCCLMWNDEGSIHKRVLNPSGNWCNSTLFRAVVMWNSSGMKRRATVSQLDSQMPVLSYCSLKRIDSENLGRLIFSRTSLNVRDICHLKHGETGC